MRKATYQVDGDKLLEGLFEYFTNNGLENITIREVCKGTGFSQGTLYYWFGDKSKLINEVSCYGIKKVMDKIFEYVFDKTENVEQLFSNITTVIDSFSKELRFIYQVAASPVYGTFIRKKGTELKLKQLKNYITAISKKLNCEEEKLFPLAFMFISTILDYVIWNEKEKTQSQLRLIYQALTEIE